MNPEELVNDAAIRKAIAMIQRIAKDKALLERMKQPAEQQQEAPMDEEPMEQPMAAPDKIDEDDQAIMEAM